METSQGKEIEVDEDFDRDDYKSGEWVEKYFVGSDRLFDNAERK